MTNENIICKAVSDDGMNVNAYNSFENIDPWTAFVMGVTLTIFFLIIMWVFREQIKKIIKKMEA